MKVNKRELVRKIIDQLEEERSLLFRAARAAHFEATDEQSKAENKYDTRGLEASYLARGQARKVKEVEQAIHQFESLDVRDFGENDPVQLGALVEIKNQKTRSYYFLGPQAGGSEVQIEKKDVLVITPQSPLGQHVSGKTKGSRLSLELGGVRQDLEITSIW